MARMPAYRNDGAGTFSDTTASDLPQDASYIRALALGDLDRDGDLDLVAGTRLYLNDGGGAFVDDKAFRLPPTVAPFSLVLGDVDGDSDLDLIVGSSGGQNRLFLNYGTGSFTGT